MSDNASALASTANGSDRGTRLGHLADLVERAAGNPASGLPVVNHGEAQSIGVHTVRSCPKHALLTFIDRNGVSHAVILTRARLIEFNASLQALKRADAPPRKMGDPVPKPSGRIL